MQRQQNDSVICISEKFMSLRRFCTLFFTKHFSKLNSLLLAIFLYTFFKSSIMLWFYVCRVIYVFNCTDLPSLRIFEILWSVIVQDMEVQRWKNLTNPVFITVLSILLHVCTGYEAYCIREQKQSRFLNWLNYKYREKTVDECLYYCICSLENASIILKGQS